MHNYYLYLVLKQRTFWSVVKQHMKIRVKSESIDLHILSVLKQHTCFYSALSEVLHTTQLRSQHRNSFTIFDQSSNT